jgi:hypothetical protein
LANVAIKDIGEVWANMLHNVYAALISAHGWSVTARTDPSGTGGNIVFLDLFIDALVLQHQEKIDPPEKVIAESEQGRWILNIAKRGAGLGVTVWTGYC